MRLFKKGNIYYIDYADASGKRHRESTGTGNKKLAEQIAAKRQVETLEHKKMGIKPVKHILLKDFIGQYIEYSKANKKAKSTEIDIMALKNLSSFINDENKYIDDVTEEEIEKYKIHRGKSVSISTITRELTSLKHFFSMAERWNKTKTNPAKNVKKPGEPPGRVRYLTKDEIPRLLSECKKLSYLHLFVVIALHTGMRKGEILGLKWEDIDFDNELIHLRDSKSVERADIIMNSVVKRYMEGFTSDGENIFPVDDLKRSFKGALNRAKIKNFRIHDLRHTFASHLAMSGTPLATLKELMRHKDIKMTLRYAHLSPSHKRQSVENLAQIWHTESFGVLQCR